MKVSRIAPPVPVPGSSWGAALILAVIGLYRFAGDILTDLDPEWYRVLGDSWIRYTMRVPSDGSFLGDLNVRYFKILAIPCAMSVIFLFRILISRDRKESQYYWNGVSTRMIWIGCLYAGVTVMELEKTTHFLGLRMAGLLTGEIAWLDHLNNFISAVLGWFTMKWLKFVPPAPPRVQGSDKAASPPR